ncbi:tetrahydrofolate dehydrogenase/cyclohydrolase [Parvularcula bermudensis HTCC2503]|uniref:Bifunctional protein FolD n=1 Tax=Parvularcula bermudensis (strain ATCC BAA-594 / HTCC2503 / KCTC 12087) TaxID=314260 RepID=E0TFT5_PARBH|nr:bifunctional methylenetetrahydrofolate dehydrogenase/methenyltetrahydrofolate cyclohydrolase FolD [Parvularcula bermudensis]ADM09100.1 tetrahydrofolate dehydrogenase/cyclohydrolase [Parvularcula bermudensis HTCC2503]
MGARLIDGKAQAAIVRAKVKVAAGELAARLGRPPCLAVVLVGADPASEVYVRNKVKLTKAVGMTSIERRLPETIDQATLDATLTDLNENEEVDGILLQMPIPAHLDTDRALSLIDPAKDVDGLTPISAGALVLGRAGLVPCTPQGAMILIQSVLGPDLSGRTAIVLGRSILVGKPLSLLLQSANATVTMAHSRSPDLPALCRSADILCAAVGRPELVRGDWIKPGAVVIDVGINRVIEEGRPRLIGDVAFGEAESVADAVTPVPGGVGPMTIACLLRNTVLAAARQAGEAIPHDL